jgi:catechol 2,3-dioxygenase-like lactoylglutathione lyase family enzyme
VLERLTVFASDLEASTRFYATVLAPIGGGSGDLAISAGTPPTRGLHIGFYVPTTELVHAFWEAGTTAGYRDDGRPGPRPVYGDDYYGGFLLDPDGNSVEAMTHDAQRTQGQIDHLWIRVADVDDAASAAERLCGPAGYERAERETDPDLVRFRSPDGTFSVLHDGGRVTENAVLALAGGAELVIGPHGIR